MLDTFAFDDEVQAPFRMQPGLKRVPDDRAQFTPLEPGSRHQREKLAVLSATAGDAMQTVAGFDARPALDAVCARIATEHPTCFTWDGEGLQASKLGVSVRGDALHVDASGVFGLGDEIPRCLDALEPAWRRAGLLALALAEDLAIVDGGTGHVPWMCVALPSRWAPRDKVGRHFVEIHRPVADNATLLKAGEHLLRLVCRPERLERHVWSVTDHARLNAHPDVVHQGPWLPAAFTSQAAGAPGDHGPGAWFRAERQSFLPLPERTQAVFAIHVDVQPLHRVVHDAARARRLHDAIASMSEAVLDYRRLREVRSVLLAWLAARAGGSDTA
jgi:dimethylamine monooxygenase subunit A